MAFNHELQLELPNGFPSDDFSAFVLAARGVLVSSGDLWKEFGGASNIIGWRFRGAHEQMTEYIASWSALGANVSFEELYRRERALFGMFCCGLSCIDSACYALYALASHASVLGIPFGEQEQRKCNPGILGRAIETFRKADQLSAAIKSLVDSEEWKLWKDFRNRMSHRSNLPRVIYAAVGAPAPVESALRLAATSSTPAIEADCDRLKTLLARLAESLRALLLGGLALTL